MAFDGILFYKLGLELKALETGKINKIQEASQNEFLFTIRRNKENYKLLISLSANYPRIHITNESYDFPREPKSFTMLLRKYFEGSQIMEITTHETDRVMAITCSKYNDMGDFEKKTLIIEILGRYSNLIVVEDSKILEAFHHLGLGELRVILPNGNYNYPDTLGKINPMNLSLEDLETLVRTNNSPKELSSKILGLSLKTAILAFDSENPSQKLYELIHDNTPCLYFDGKKNDITYYKVDGGTFFPSFSNLLDAYFKEEALKERIKAKTGNIESFIDKQLTRNLNKKHKLEDELQKADEADKYRLYGELLIANNYLSGHKKNITVLNYYTNENVTIPLDERYDIMGNSKLYFKKYQKSKNAISHINEQLSIIEEELAYFNILKSQIKVCDLKDALEIQQELIDNHYMILKNKPEKLQKTKITTYLLPSGHTVLVGKNNIQNDLVTNKMARPLELWFHVKDMPGSHVLLQSSDEATEEEIRTCANLAAYFSEARNSSSVPVNYTRAKNIKKIPGHKNCFVSIKGEKTIFIDPDIELINKLELKK